MDHKHYWVYIVASNSGTLYIGITSKLYVRTMQHKSGEIDGFSSKYKCNRLVYYESFGIVQKAIGREKHCHPERSENVREADVPAESKDPSEIECFQSVSGSFPARTARAELPATSRVIPAE